MFAAVSKIEFRNEFIVKIVTLESSRAKVISGYYEGDENRVRPWITDGSIYNNGIYSDQQTHISISSNKQYRGTKSGSLFPSINRAHWRRRTMTVTRRSAINRGDRSRYSRATGVQFICERDKIAGA